MMVQSHVQQINNFANWPHSPMGGGLELSISKSMLYGVRASMKQVHFFTLRVGFVFINISLFSCFFIFKSANTRRYIMQASAVFAQGAVPVILLPLFQTLRWLQDGWQAGERSVGFHLPGSLGEMPHHLYPPHHHHHHDHRHQDHDHKYLYDIRYSLSLHWHILNYSGPRSIW